MKDDMYCMGVQCPIKTQCLRYTDGIKDIIEDGTTVKFFRKCTNQKKFLQDSTKIVKSNGVKC